MLNYLSKYATLLYLRNIIFVNMPYYYKLIRYILETELTFEKDDDGNVDEDEGPVLADVMWPSYESLSGQEDPVFEHEALLLVIFHVFNMKQEELLKNIEEEGSIGLLILKTYTDYISAPEEEEEE